LRSATRTATSFPALISLLMVAGWQPSISPVLLMETTQSASRFSARALPASWIVWVQ
jgi:hypothetical protein